MEKKLRGKSGEEKSRVLKFAFFGSGAFACILLNELLKRNIKPILVVTVPDKPRGRGLKVKPQPIKLIAEEAGIEVLQPEKLKDSDFLKFLKEADPDIIILSDYGKIIPEEVLNVPRIGSWNLHPSLLPKFRGAAPIERAIMEGEKKLGVTLIEMTEEVDAGPVILMRELHIEGDETKGEVREKLAILGAELIEEALNLLLQNKLEKKPQMGEPTRAPKIKKEELWINWGESKERVINKIRALSPDPGARTKLDGEYVKILRAKEGVISDIPSPGRVLIKDKRLYIGCRDGWIEILELIPEGKRKMTGEEYTRGHSPTKAE